MDIQGAEMLALEGMEKTLKKNDNLLLLTEFWPYAIEKSGFLPSEFIEKIQKFGFKIFELKNGKTVSFSINAEIVKRHSKIDFINLFCKKN